MEILDNIPYFFYPIYDLRLCYEYYFLKFINKILVFQRSWNKVIKAFRISIHQ